MDAHGGHLLTDIGVATIAATALGLLAHVLRQPVILGYLIAGALIGPIGYGWVMDLSNIQTISEIGLVLLLFIIGLEMNLAQVASSGRQLLISGFGQFPFGLVVGLLFFPLVGLALTGTVDAKNPDGMSGLYLALICGLSSTAIVVKLLYDTFSLDTIPGRLTVGILVIQDIFAILILAFQPNFASPSIMPIAQALGGAALLLGIGFLMSKYVLSRVFAAITKNPELVVATSIGWCVAVAGGAAALGLSKEMGALVAGLSISAFPYALHVTAKTMPLRDFFLTLFFVSLGMQIQVPPVSMLGTIAIVVGFTVGSRFLTVFPLLYWSGSGRRTAFIASLNLAQISEFGLVIATLGLTLNHIPGSTFQIVLFAMAITAVMSSYGIRYAHPLFTVVDKLFGWHSEAPAAAVVERHRDLVLLGYHRVAAALVDRLERDRPDLLRRLMVIDFNLETLKKLEARGVAGRFGDLASMDTLDHTHIEHAKVIVSTIPDMLLKGVDNKHLVSTCRALAPHALVIATAETPGCADILKNAGADEVFQLYDLSAAALVVRLDALPTPASQPAVA